MWGFVAPVRACITTSVLARWFATFKGLSIHYRASSKDACARSRMHESMLLCGVLTVSWKTCSVTQAEQGY